MSRLSRTTLETLPPTIVRPGHGRDTAIGIVHFGPGAFHRAHQASYIDTVLDHDPRWGIAAVSMRSRGTVAALAEQDGLYTLGIRDTRSEYRIIDAHRAFLAPDDAAEVQALLADPGVGLVTTTVTEKGYCLGADGTLDMDHADIRHDLSPAGPPRSVVGWIVAGLRARRQMGTHPFVPMPCDNLASNGPKLHAALVAFARATDPTLADWIAGEVRVPSTMVDSITPASDAAFLADVTAALGVKDHAAVQREAFTQWVIEDIGRSSGSGLGLPDLAAAGATVTADVGGYERAKLRILNGTHSTLAYAGLLRGHASVAEAMRDAELAGFIEDMMMRDIIAVLPPVAGLDLHAYAQDVLARFRNPAIVHRLDQIAQDGSQKLPYRLGDTLLANRQAGRMPQAVVAALGCWVAFLIERVRTGAPIIDPAAATLTAAASDADPATVVERLLAADTGLSARWSADVELVEGLKTAAAAAARRDWSILS